MVLNVHILFPVHVNLEIFANPSKAFISDFKTLQTCSWFMYTMDTRGHIALYFVFHYTHLY